MYTISFKLGKIKKKLECERTEFYLFKKKLQVNFLKKFK